MRDRHHLLFVFVVFVVIVQRDMRAVLVESHEFQHAAWTNPETAPATDAFFFVERVDEAPQRTLDADRLTRISYLIGIFKALNILYSEKLADRWVRLPNSNPIFGGCTPLGYMTKGGQPAMQTVRRLLDARRGGV